jgi:GntR family transcriptional repressor for pyruvate dehydrogenase complex
MPRRSTLSDHVVQELIRDIRDRGLVEGDEIPAEGELAERYGINRLAVREAIRTLVARGVLISSQGKRARVSGPTPHVLRQTLEFQLSQNSLDMLDLVQTREVIEGALARRAADRVAAGDRRLDSVAAALEDMRASGGSSESFIRADLAFHSAIAEAADAKLLTFILVAMNDVLLDARRASFEGRARRGSSQNDVIAAHQRILDAIAAGDPEAAGTAMIEHLHDSRLDLGLA